MDRSLTPPLDPKLFDIKLKENGKIIAKPIKNCSLYDDEEQLEITKNTPPPIGRDKETETTTPIRTVKPR